MPTNRRSSPLFALLLATACAVGAAAALASPAEAARRHTRLVRSIPARDSVIREVPAQLSLWFSEPIALRVSRVRLVGADLRAVNLVPLARAAAVDAPVTAPLPSPLADGRYTVHWSTASEDGHVVRDSFAFTVRRR